MPKNTRCTQRGFKKTPVNMAKVEDRIATVKRTIAELEKTPPPLGDKWRDGMLKYYRHVLSELEAYRGSTR